MADKDHFDDDSLYDKQKAFHNEEYAKELAADQYHPNMDEAESGSDHPRRTYGRSLDRGKGIGWFALVLSVAALFFLPVILGAAGIIIGYLALREGARTLGGWAIGIGCAAVFIQLLSPLFT